MRYSGLLLDPLEAPAGALQWIPRRSRVLDVGCGAGAFARETRDRLGCDVLGIEPNPERAAAAEQDGTRVLCGYLTADLAHVLGQFDAIVFLDVLEHAADPTYLLSVACKMLAPEGIVVISVPNVAHWTVRLKLLFGRFDYQPTGIMDATHLRWFTARTIRRVVESSGLQVLEQTVSRGTWLPTYHSRAPWRWLGDRGRRRTLDVACRAMPALFGCQHLVRAGRNPEEN